MEIYYNYLVIDVLKKVNKFDYLILIFDFDLILKF